MKIWFVNFEDLSCAWSSFEKAEAFVMNEGKRCGWEFCGIRNRFKNEWIVYEFRYNNEIFFIPVTYYEVDKKPYLD